MVFTTCYNFVQLARIINYENFFRIKVSLIQIYKIVTPVPARYVQKVIKAMSEAGAGKIGNYSHCALTTRSIGYFQPEKGATSFIGKVGQLKVVEEYRIEMSCPKNKKKAVIAAIRKSHPYEEPVIDVYKLNDVNT